MTARTEFTSPVTDAVTRRVKASQRVKLPSPALSRSSMVMPVMAGGCAGGWGATGWGAALVGAVSLGGEVVFAGCSLGVFGFCRSASVEVSDRGVRGTDDDCVALG
jgi:hypothetical protein